MPVRPAAGSIVLFASSRLNPCSPFTSPWPAPTSTIGVKGGSGHDEAAPAETPRRHSFSQRSNTYNLFNPAFDGLDSSGIYLTLPAFCDNLKL
jgi:hypothetical protein